MTERTEISEAGDSAAPNFDQVWSQYQSGVKGLLKSRVSNDADADDILQEILLRTYRKLHTVKSEETIKSWLFQISRNAIVDHYRKKGRNREDAEVSAESAYEEDSVDVQQHLAKCVQPFIKSLPDEARQVLTAIDIEGRSQKEYAEELGIKYSTLKSRVQRSRSQLKGLFENCCQFSRDGRGNIADYNVNKSGCNNC